MNKKKLDHDWFFLRTKEENGVVSVTNDDETNYILEPVELKWLKSLAFKPELLKGYTTEESHEFWAEAIPLIYNIVTEKRQMYAELGLR